MEARLNLLILGAALETPDDPEEAHRLCCVSPYGGRINADLVLFTDLQDHKRSLTQPER